MTKSAHDEFYQDKLPPTATELPVDVIVSSDTLRENRIPPGQTRTRKWPVLDAHGTPIIRLPHFKLRVFGEVANELRLTLDEVGALPRTRVFADFHCVTQWSRLGNLWEGFHPRELIERAKVNDAAKFVILYGADYGFTTNLPIESFLAEDVLIADHHDGRPLTADHGGPLRAIVPKLYAWKSAKWLKAIEFTTEDRPGYWEAGGYHNQGDPWKEERYSGSGNWWKI